MADQPLLTLVKPPGRISFPDIRGTIRFRSLIARLAARDITLRYRQTLFGVAWVVAQPLLGAGVLWLVFGRVANLDAGNGFSYFVLTFAGTVLWTSMSQGLTRVTNSLVLNPQLVSKVYFPRLVIPVSFIWSGLLDTFVAFLLLLVLLATGPGVSVALLLAPLWFLFCLLLACGFGLASATFTVRYRDVQQVLPWLVQLMFFASPVAYRLDAVPPSLRWVYVVNPVTGLLEGFRWSTVGGPLSTGLTVWSIAASVAAAVVGLLIFGRWERIFADVI